MRESPGRGTSSWRALPEVPRWTGEGRPRRTGWPRPPERTPRGPRQPCSASAPWGASRSFAQLRRLVYTRERVGEGGSEGLRLGHLPNHGLGVLVPPSARLEVLGHVGLLHYRRGHALAGHGRAGSEELSLLL